MATWLDLLALAITFSVIIVVIFGIQYASRQFQESVESTKEALKSKGLHISNEGIAVKTSRRFDREDYVDATQRGLIKAINASSFGTDSVNGAGSGSVSPSTPSPRRQNSYTEAPAEEKKKRGSTRRAFTLGKDSK